MDDSEKEDLQKFSDMDDERNKKAIEGKKKRLIVRVFNPPREDDDTPAREEQLRRDAYFKKHGSA